MAMACISLTACYLLIVHLACFALPFKTSDVPRMKQIRKAAANDWMKPESRPETGWTEIKTDKEIVPQTFPTAIKTGQGRSDASLPGTRKLHASLGKTKHQLQASVMAKAGVHRSPRVLAQKRHYHKHTTSGMHHPTQSSTAESRNNFQHVLKENGLDAEKEYSEINPASEKVPRTITNDGQTAHKAQYVAATTPNNDSPEQLPFHISNRKETCDHHHHHDHHHNHHHQNHQIQNHHIDPDDGVKPFSCQHCRCIYNSTMGGIVADCSFRRLSSFPLSLPRDVVFINMASNILPVFNMSVVLRYPCLAKLNLTSNVIKSVFLGSNATALSQLNCIDISQNKIPELNDSIFRITPNLETLRVSLNQIKQITNKTLSGLKRLRLLDLCKNPINRIDMKAFDSLIELRDLYINNNNLGYSKRHLHPKLTQHLTKLEKLYIQGNQIGGDRYPDTFLGNLINLQKLVIDGLPHGAELGPQLKRLTNLTSLSIGGERGSCHLKNVSSTFFQNVPYLKSISFERCKFHHIDPKTFHSLPHLEEYEVRHVKTYDLDLAFEGLEGLVDSPLKSLTFVNLYHTAPQCRVLSIRQGRHIQNFSLELLDLSSNRLSMLQKDFLDCVPKTLKKLILVDNRFTLEGNLLNRIPFLVNLIELDMRIQNVDAWAVRYLLNAETSHTNRPMEGRHFEELDRTQDLTFEQSSCSSTGNMNTDRTCNTTYTNAAIQTFDQHLEYQEEANSIRHGKLNLPPNLQIIRTSKYSFLGEYLLLHDIINGNLTELYFSSSFLTYWGYGHLPSTVQIADFSNNNCQYLHAKFFPPNNSLRHLSIQNNYLGFFFASDTNGHFLAELDRLLDLDISVSLIFHLPRRFLTGLHRLRRLNLSNNKLQVLDVELSHMEDLSSIDASKNSITWITKKTRQDLDVIASRRSVTLDLTNNPLPCNCHGREILHWMVKTPVTLYNATHLKCVLDNGDIWILGDIGTSLESLDNHCTSYKVLITGCVSAACGLLLAFIGSTCLYRNRYRLMYAINSVVLSRMFGFRPCAGDADRFMFDAFVVYAEEDRQFVLGDVLRELERKRGHCLCVGDRNFIPGTVNFNNIANAVQNSAVTLVVVSSNFECSGENIYTLQMALMEEYLGKVKREVCQLVLYGPLPTRTLHKDVQMLMVKGRHIDYPHISGENMDHARKIFWDRLSQSIGHSHITALTTSDDFVYPNSQNRMNTTSDGYIDPSHSQNTMNTASDDYVDPRHSHSTVNTASDDYVDPRHSHSTVNTTSDDYVDPCHRHNIVNTTSDDLYVYPNNDNTLDTTWGGFEDPRSQLLG